MRYFTKEWYALCQKTGLHFCLEVHKDAGVFSEELYQRLRKKREKEIIKQEREFYDFDPRELLDVNGTVFVRADKFLTGDDILPEDTMIYEMEEEEKARINELVKAFDSRGAFDVEKSMNIFNQRHEMTLEDNVSKIPEAVYSQIADSRVFALGYTVEKIIDQLKSVSEQNEKQVQAIRVACIAAQQSENISLDIRRQFGFHDCKVIRLEKANNITILFDTSGEASVYNKLVFHDVYSVEGEHSVEGCRWLYEELYKTQNGYEVHMLFASGENRAIELTVTCRDIMAGKE